MNALGLNPTSLAKKMGKRQSTINSFIIGRNKTFRDISALAVSLETNEQWLLTGSGSPDAAMHTNKINIPYGNESQSQVAYVSEVTRVDMPRYKNDLIPILGYANGSSEALMINFNEKIGEVARHPAQGNMIGAFALEAFGESMSPRIRPGDLVFSISNKRPSKQQDCIVELHNGESFIKEFSRTTEKEIICLQLNPPKEWRRKLEDIKAIHAIVGLGF